MSMLEDTLTADDLALCLGALTTPQQLSAATAVCWRWCRLARSRSLLLRLLFTQATELSLKERDRPIFCAPSMNEAGYSNNEELAPPCSKWGELYPELQPLVDAYQALDKGKKDVVVSFPSTFVLIKMVTLEGDVVATHATRAALRVLLEKRGKPTADERGCDDMEMLIEGVTMSAGWQEQNLVAHVLFINTERERAFAVTPLQGLKMSEGACRTTTTLTTASRTGRQLFARPSPLMSTLAKEPITRKGTGKGCKSTSRSTESWNRRRSTSLPSGASCRTMPPSFATWPKW